MINDNAYKVLLDEYGVSATFNVIDLIKSNPFKERGNDVDHAMNTKDPLHVLNRPITRSKIKALKEVLNGLVVQVSAKTKHGDLLEHQEEVLVHLFQCKRYPIHLYFGHKVSTTRLLILYQFWSALFCDVSMCFMDS
jgi:hypothetical protein